VVAVAVQALAVQAPALVKRVVVVARLASLRRAVIAVAVVDFYPTYLLL